MLYNKYVLRRRSIPRNTWHLRFKARRLALGLTQEQVAERLGVTQQTISTFEADGDLDPRISRLERYAEAVKSTVEELFPMEGRP